MGKPFSRASDGTMQYMDDEVEIVVFELLRGNGTYSYNKYVAEVFDGSSRASLAFQYTEFTNDYAGFSDGNIVFKLSFTPDVYYRLVSELKCYLRVVSGVEVRTPESDKGVEEWAKAVYGVSGVSGVSWRKRRLVEEGGYDEGCLDGYASDTLSKEPEEKMKKKKKKESRAVEPTQLAEPTQPL